MKSIYIKGVLRALLFIIAAQVNTTAFAYTGEGGTDFERDLSGIHFLINNKEDFLKLVAESSYWEYDFLQTADIDLEGAVITPIGTDIDDNKNYTKAFRGSYNGQGFTLKNAVIYWDSPTSDNKDCSAKALFGVVTCNGRNSKATHEKVGVRNLNVENIHLTRSSSATADANKGHDYRLSVLIGHLDNNVDVSNISISNCKIDAGANTTNVRSLLVGGAIADISSAYGGTNAYDFNGTLNNIYCNIDIDLSKVRRDPTASQASQFVIGGIVGRMRRSYLAKAVPTNTVFSGKIDAPYAAISPVVGQMRADGVTNYTMSSLFNYYAGQINTATKNDVFDQWYSVVESELVNAGLDSSAESIVAKISESRYFTDYQIKNNTEEQIGNAMKGDWVQITNTFPEAESPSGQPNIYGIRTLLPSSSARTNYDKHNATDWAHVQGVNFGKYADPSSEAQQNALQDMLSSGNLTYWEWEKADDGHFKLHNTFKPTPSDFILSITTPSGNDYLFTADVKFNSTLPIGYSMPEGTYQWFKSASPTAGSWDLIYGATSNTYDVSENPDMYYRCEWKMDGTDVNWGVVAGYRGPRKVIYVYDKDETERFLAYLPDYLKVFDISAFEGIYGDDLNNTGTTPEAPVRTMERAYQLLDEQGSWDTNQIVVMGVYNEHSFLLNKDEDRQQNISGDYFYKKPVTITGTDGRTVKGGILCLWTSGGTDVISLRAPLRLNRIDCVPDLTNSLVLYPGGTTYYDNQDTKYSYNQIHSLSVRFLMFACNFCDFMVDTDVRFLYYDYLDNNMGLPGNITSVPRITIIGGGNNENKPEGSQLVYSDYNQTQGVATIELRSGIYGRIICAGRNSVVNSLSHNITGSPADPASICLKVNINGFNENGFSIYGATGAISGTEPWPDENGNPVYTDEKKTKLRTRPSGFTFNPNANFSHDIGLVAGGQTDGTAYGDINVYVYNARVARLTTGNIAYGREIKVSEGNYRPSDSFYGKSVMNIYDGEFNEIYGGNLGRFGSSTEGLLSSGFYGMSVINMYGGVVKVHNGRVDATNTKLKNIEPSIYGAGAGGTTGLGDDEHHTTDPLLPYYNSEFELCYGPWESAEPNTEDKRLSWWEEHMPEVTVKNGDSYSDVNLINTKCEVNLYGGTVNGNIYGAGYGYSIDLSYCHATPEVGNFHGYSYVKLDRQPNGLEPTVLGNIYGAGAGKSEYATKFEAGRKANNADYQLFLKGWKKYYGEDLPENYNPFEKVAQQYGRSFVTLYAGTVGDRENHKGGKVFGGSLGVEGYPDMSALYGSSHLEIDGTTYIVGNVYGGSQMGSIFPYGEDDGSTYLDIKDGTFGNCIFGGSEGEFSKKYLETEGHLDYTLKISGSTNSKILGGAYTSYSWVGPEANQNHKNFNIYGGGFYNCEVEKDANLEIRHSLFEDMESLDPGFLSFGDAWDDPLFRKFCVYGGGYGENATVHGTTNLTIDIEDTQVLVTPDDNNAFYSGKQFFDVCGGGYSGWVGNTNVIVRGNVNIRKLVGGGFYSWVGKFERVVDQDNVPQNDDFGNPLEKLVDGTGRAYCRLESGVVETVVGGSLLGNVHYRARTVIGTRLITDGSANDNSARADEIALANSRLFVTGNVFGANDVMGIVGTVPFRESEVYHYGDVKRDKVFYEELEKVDKGAFIAVYGGNIRGSVYGAGNGYYRGYWVPGWARYLDGPERFYRIVPGPGSDGTASEKVYMSRPTTGRVNINISGNSATDRVVIDGNVFGGGKMCSIGRWYPYGSMPKIGDIQVTKPLHLGDPGRYVGGGELKMNFGSHVTVKHHVHMGADGELISKQTTLPYANDDAAYNDLMARVMKGHDVSTNDLDLLGAAAYVHWYWYQPDTSAPGKYLLGYPSKGTPMQPNLGSSAIYNKWLVGEHQFYAFIKNIEMNAKVNLTFFEDPFQADEVGGIPINKEQPDYADISEIVKTPEESSGEDYFTSTDVEFESFFLGGHAGFMTYEKEYTSATPGKGTYSYELVLPTGLTVKNKVVAGAEDSWIKYYNYTDQTCREIKYEDANGVDLKPEYELLGGISIPQIYERYTKEDEDNNLGYQGELKIDENNHAVITKGTRKSEFAMRLSCTANFEPQLDPDLAYDSEGNLIDESALYGGLIYGGCFNSGVIHGDVVLNIASNLLGTCDLFDPANPNHALDHNKSLKFRVGRVFGGGYGEDTRIEGRTIVNILKDFKGLNVFGGGSQGLVKGVSQVNYVGTDDSYIYGSIYGGGLLGSVGMWEETQEGEAVYYPETSELAGQIKPKKIYTNDDPLPYGSKVFAYAGNVGSIYGGSCFGDVYGGTLIYAADEIRGLIDNFPYQTISWKYNHLVCGNIFGGNNVSGNIYRFEDGIDETTKKFEHYTSTDIHIREEGTKDQEQLANPSPGSHLHPSDDEQLNGSLAGEGATEEEKRDKTGLYTGFPLIGNLYCGSNGNYGSQEPTFDDDDNFLGNIYKEDASFTIAMGEANSAQFMALPLKGVKVPDIDRSTLIVKGGTIINCFGGGNRATVTDRNFIDIQYNDTVARAGFKEEAQARRLWNLLNQETEVEFTEALQPENAHYVHKYQILRLFGGNNHADMDIQPSWNLQRGHIASVYSGGNIGRMTYYAPPAVGESKGKGLSLTVNSADIHIEAVYGGGRIGDICAMDANGPVKFTAENPFYGATLNIKNGLIEAVYGGNDVSGNVFNGTNVNISGAISGDVYGAGNGNYLYYYDKNNEKGYSAVTEAYDDQEYKSRYFILPNRNEFGAAQQQSTDPAVTDAQVVMAINSYRPHVERSFLNIEGSEDSHVWVKGSVYCGGNSSTIASTTAEGDIRFNIGDYVTLNSVFLGSNGESLALGSMIERTEKINNINITGTNDLTSEQIPESEASAVTYKGSLYKTILDLYMRAVEVTALPKNFQFPENLNKSYIGEFCIGGNQGSMMYNKTIELTFPQQLVIYQRIIGGCRKANVTYRDCTYVGGLTMPLLDGYTEKVHLIVRNQFKPMILHYPDETQNPPILLHNYMVNDKGESIMKRNASGKMVVDPSYTGKRYYQNGQCVVYGGCYLAGRTVGDIHLDIYSDMLRYEETVPVDEETVPIDKKAIVDGINDFSWRSFDVIGAGYGRDTEVYGDVHVLMRPTGVAGTRPSAATIFGGSREGVVVGNTYVEVRDGKVLTNVYGGNESSILYGSTHVIIGYPQYYKTLTSGRYDLTRVDDLSKGYYSGDIIDNVFYRQGDYVPANVYQMIKDTDKATKFELCNVKPTDIGSKWDNILIWIGDQSSLSDPEKPYYSHGNVYGGGFISNKASMALAGQNTVRTFDFDHLPLNTATFEELDPQSFGGNSSVMIWDNRENANLANTSTASNPTLDIKGNSVAGSNAKICDHVSIGTGIYMPVKLRKDDYLMGYFLGKKDEEGKWTFTLQSEGQYNPSSGNTYYEIEADGGIYGGGRQVYVSGFAAIDLGYYGYADYAAPFGKLLNTIQRADVATITDCCIELNGASDFTHVALDGQVNTTSYSINRVNELHLNSSLDPTAALAQFDATTGSYPKRSRNYIAFFRHVHLLSALKSNWGMKDHYHDWEGKVVTGKKFVGYKHDKIIDYFTATTPIEADFNMRNVGTSANMIGLNSGYSLRIQGYGRNKSVDDLYYGPAFGVTEVKLITSAPGEGGGYVFALNHHYDDKNDVPYPYDVDLLSDETNPQQDFLQTTGNFVFATPIDSGSDLTYIIDDCFPFGMGYQGYKAAWKAAHPSATSRSDDEFDINDFQRGEDQEIHYWYINGTKYYYNVTITGITNDSDLTQFFMDNHDNLVYLPGLSPDTPAEDQNLKIESVSWRLHNDSGFDCDLRDLTKDYSLFFTVDKNSQSTLNPSDLESDKNGAYVAEITRGEYELNADGTVKTNETIRTEGDIPVGANVDPNNPSNGSFSNKTIDGATVKNVPILGIRLDDRQKNRFADNSDPNYGVNYYNNHLADPDKVTVVITNSDERGTRYQYTINLNIEYILGPAMTGNIEIENCALPGEYIYVKVDPEKVIVNMDQTNLVVTKRYWKIYPTRYDEATGKRVRVPNQVIKIDPTDPSLIEQSAPYIITTIHGETPTTLREIHIPAYYYQNGWEVAYVETAAGVDFETSTSPEAEEENRTLTIHNYHRMKPMYGTDIMDLQLTEGCRVYIEDDADMAYWLEYLAAHQGTDKQVTAPDGHILHPQYLEGIDFYVQENVKLPDSSLGTSVTFAGNFHGNGRHIDIGEHTTVNLKLSEKAKVYNTGFYSENDNDDTCVFNNSEGGIYNCYYFNTHNKGMLVNNPPTGTAVVKNCYQNSKSHKELTNMGFSFDQLLYLSPLAFRYGQAAYNLNGFYLQKRHMLLNEFAALSDNNYKPSTSNNPLILAQLDALAKKYAHDNQDETKYNVAYIESMFNNGDYRYAYAKESNVHGVYKQFTEMLRTEIVPNYYDRLDCRGNGRFASAHDPAHDRDDARWSEDDQMYRPNFNIDYLFFGQDLRHRPGETTSLPNLFTPETRVYRIGGFYGDNTDKGYFVNVDATIDSDILTAVDFVGYRDRDLYDKTTGLMKDDVENEIARATNANGWYIEPGQQEIYFPPTLDKPYDAEGHVHFNSITVDDEVVTHNLLVYITGVANASDPNPMMGNYDYVGTTTFNSANDFAMHDENLVHAHIIFQNPTDFEAMPVILKDYFHLVDNHIFWCPVPFKAKQAWYTRQPLGYSDHVANKTAWEGICLPFTAKLVYAASSGKNPTLDHGEITHFYGAEDEKENILHEYWLRRFTGINASKGDGKTYLLFERPTESNANADEDFVETKHYENDFFGRIYEHYNYQSFDDSPFNHDAYLSGRDMKDYRYLSASVPYIVTFPGIRYYEFDLSGEFFASKVAQAEPHPQTICYMLNDKFAEYPNQYIVVPQTTAPEEYVKDGYTFTGTFGRKTVDQLIAVQELYDPKDNSFNGTQFVAVDNGVIGPFRTYVVRPTTSNAPLLIGSRASEEMIQEQDPDLQDPEELEDQISGFRFYMDRGDLMIDAPYECKFTIYNMMGQALHQIQAYEGTNRYTGLSSGFYIVHNFKFAIR